MTYTIFFYSRLSVSKGSLVNNFLVFCGGSLVVEARGQLPSLPPLKSGLTGGEGDSRVATVRICFTSSFA